MKIGRYYRVINKRLNEEFVLKYIRLDGRIRMVYIYWRNIPKISSPNHLGECQFPHEKGDVEVEIKKDEVFMEVI